MLHRSGLDQMTVTDERVVIGAMIPVARLADAPDELLASFARRSPTARSARTATVGGNICAPPGREFQRGDLGAPLIALGARVRSAGSGGERTEPIEDFLGVRPDGAARARGGVRPVAAEVRREHACGAGTPIRTRSRASRPARARTAATCASASPGVGPTAVRSRAVEASRDAASVLDDVEPGDDAVATATTAGAVLPLLVREALDRLEAA